ncbi:hypothetical protein HZB96_02200 [Candidatus Gottesmanbacteria bacterium]|nr:hypothetical protein [Candidatus Gottesmanbacteria bacterium]
MSNPFGGIFPEEIIKEEKLGKFSSSISGSLDTPERVWLFVIILVLGLSLLFGRLSTLTLFEGSSYRKLAEGNRIRESTIPAPRGIIYDRNGNILVRNIPTFSLSNGQVFFENIPGTVSGEIKESISREYEYGELFAHSLGFVGEINEGELKKLNINPSSVYKIGDMVGKMGIEKYYDQKLRGRDGKQLQEVDAFGKVVRILGKVDPAAGENLQLSLSVPLQKSAAEGLKDKKGAVVAADPKTGQILALYSSPSFDPNAFIRDVNVEKILTAEDRQLFNRAIAGLYPPGSTFKIITALSALETGSISKSTQFEDTGVLQVGQYSYGNWYFNQYGKKEGMLDIVGAIKRSNDIFFYKTGEVVGIEKLSDWAKKIGVGKILGIDIPEEEAGLMPDAKWQKETRGEDWYLGNTYHVAIGQGDVLTTDDIPMDVACKTGTAEFGDPKNRTHAWFTVFAPVNNPQISVTVLVENGGEGSSIAGPIAKNILEEWFSH